MSDYDCITVVNGNFVERQEIMAEEWLSFEQDESRHCLSMAKGEMLRVNGKSFSLNKITP